MDKIGWWYRNSDGSYPKSCWQALGYGNTGIRWYHFNDVGYMQTGWLTDTDGHRYYLHPVSDGSQGYMYTGWHLIENKWYYFTVTKTSKNPVGSLLTNSVTPGGYRVGADGVWIQ